jgi:hypothetical protein
MPGVPTMPMGMPVNANNGVFPLMQFGPFATGVEPWQHLPSASDMKFRQIRRARNKAWKDWMLSLGLANLNLDETNEDGEKDDDDEGEPKVPESARASDSRLDPRKYWFDHLQQMRMLGPSAPWLDEEFSNLIFGDHRCCSEARERGRRVNTAREDGDCRSSLSVSTLPSAYFTLYRASD